MDKVQFLEEALSVLIENSQRLTRYIDEESYGVRIREYSNSIDTLSHLRIDENNTITLEMIHDWWSEHRPKYRANQVNRKTERLIEKHKTIAKLSREEAKILKITDEDYNLAKMYVQNQLRDEA
jgi:hypothetical protein